MTKYRAWGYAYPTSPIAIALKRGKTGCYYAGVDDYSMPAPTQDVHGPFDSAEDAAGFAMLHWPQLAWSPVSRRYSRELIERVESIGTGWCPDCIAFPDGHWWSCGTGSYETDWVRGVDGKAHEIRRLPSHD